ncbi:Uncharacterized protein APZ42_012694 [Daphnia magna]|uniref:Uncharacterized protein n=1 Tax=Daphnia magna TaxID=35525 RepID=A0A162RK61_9CRUS|nr:Uncharacterized protein APZ42_012694 [Daphnia magna]
MLAVWFERKSQQALMLDQCKTITKRKKANPKTKIKSVLLSIFL